MKTKLSNTTNRQARKRMLDFHAGVNVFLFRIAKEVISLDQAETTIADVRGVLNMALDELEALENKLFSKGE